MSDNLDLPWLQDDDNQPSEAQERSSGGTGQLPWRQLPTASPDSQNHNDDLIMDWTFSSEPTTTSQADPTKGLTGTLPWNAAASDPSEAPRDELASWLDADDKRQSSENELDPLEMGAVNTAETAWVSDLRQEIQDSSEDLPDWMLDLGAEDTPPSEADDLIPDWLLGAEDELESSDLNWMDEIEPADDDLPSWMTSDGSEFATGIYNAKDFHAQTPEAQSYEDWARENQAEEEAPPDDLDWLREQSQSYEEWARQNQTEEDDLNWLREQASDLTYEDWEAQQNEAARQLQEPDIPLPDFDLPELTNETGNLGGDYVPDWFMGVEELDDNAAPDWVKASLGKPVTAPLEDELPPLEFDDLPPMSESSVIRRLDPTPSTGEAMNLDDLFQEAQPAFDDLFGDVLPPEEDTSEPAWLQDYTPELEIDPLPEPSFEPLADPSALPDWLSEIEAPADLPPLELEFDLPQHAPDDLQDDFDLDTILGTVPTLTSPESALVPTSPNQVSSLDNFDFDDALFGDAAPVEMPLELLEDELDEDDLLYESEDLPEWMRQVQTTGDSVPIRLSGVEGYFEQVPDVVLSAELRELREITQGYHPLSHPDEPREGSILSGVVGGLGLAESLLQVDRLNATRVYDPLPEQQTRLTVLQEVLDKVQGEEALDKDNAIRFTLDEEDEEAALEDLSAPPLAKRRRVSLESDRVVISILVAVILILPFFIKPMHILGEPNASLNAEALPLTNAIDNLQTSAAPNRVLVAFEYGSTGSQELDPLAEAVLRDLIAQGTEIVVVSTNPMGILHAQHILGEFSPQIKVLRFISGGAVGVRSLVTSETTSSLFFARDIQGQETDLEIGRVGPEDFALIVVIGESFDDVRTWAEQFRPVSIPKFLLVSAAAEPFARPYLTAGQYQGMLSGVKDAISYNQARGQLSENDSKTLLAHWHSIAWGIVLASLVIVIGLMRGLITLMRGRRRA